MVVMMRQSPLRGYVCRGVINRRLANPRLSGMSCRPPSLHISHEDEIRKSAPVPCLRRGDEEERTRRGRQPAMETRGLRHGGAPPDEMIPDARRNWTGSRNT